MTSRRTPARAVALLAVLAAAAAVFPSPSARAGDPPAAGADPAKEKVGLKDFLKGELVSLDEDGKFEVRYDFSDPAQGEDFRDFRPFRVPGKFSREVMDRKLHLRGTGGCVWKPVLKKGFTMNFTMRVAVARDAGAYILEDRDSEHYTLFSVYDQFFQNKDNPGSRKTHMICRFLPGSTEFAGDLVFRYVTRTSKPDIGVGREFPVEVGREGIDDWFILDGSKMAGNEANWDALRGLRPGFYTLDSEAWYSDLVIKGTLDPDWAAGASIDPSLTVMPKKKEKPPEREPGPADETAMASVHSFTMGEGSSTEMLRIVGDATLVDATRKAAADAVIATADARLAVRCVPLLESTDLSTRILADGMVTALAGRSFGFKADGPEDKRRKAVRAVLDYIEKNPRKFQ